MRRHSSIPQANRNRCAARSTATLAGQVQKEFYVNQAHLTIDALLHLCVEDTAAAPPPAPVDGECWLVDAVPTGDWSGKAGHIACWQAGTWLFVPPSDGMKAWDRSADQQVRYRDGWFHAQVPASVEGGLTVDAEARTAIAQLVSALTDAGIFPQA